MRFALVQHGGSFLASITHPGHPLAAQAAQIWVRHARLDGGGGGLCEVDSSGENPSSVRATSPLIIDFQQLMALLPNLHTTLK